MKISEVVIAAGVGYTNVPCTGPYHNMRIYDESKDRLQLDFKTTDDSFTAVRTTTPEDGNVITLRGHGSQGILGRPADYSAVGHPATADVIAKVRTTAAAGCTVIVEEDTQQG